MKCRPNCKNDRKVGFEKYEQQEDKPKENGLNGHLFSDHFLFQAEGGREITRVEFSNEDLKKTENRRYRM